MAAQPALEVTAAGSLATVQDLGRAGYGRWGVPPGGALDASALHAANTLVGNTSTTAGIEVTLMGFAVVARVPVVVAVCGADLSPELNGRAMEMGMSHVMSPGDVLKFGHPRSGCRAYLAVGGGIQVPPVLGSRSTSLASGFGGHEGRPLARGDVLVVESPALHLACAGRTEAPLPVAPSPRVLRVLPGCEPGLEALVESLYTVSPVSSRAGIRLTGPELRRPDGELLSAGVVPGCVQVTGTGQPLVTLVETVTGGYAVPAVVIAADMRALAQLKPGDAVVFRTTTPALARQELARQAAALDALARRYPATGPA